MSFWGHKPGATISPADAAKAAEGGAQLLDIGKPTEWFAGHVHGARLVEPELVDMEFGSLAKDKQVIVIARDPEIGAAVASMLHEHGFDVCSVEGGVAAWKSAGLSLVKADGTSA